MKLAIGCPIFEREWCFDQWADSVESQRWPRGTKIEHHFVYTRGRDGTLGAIKRRFPDATINHIEHLPTFTNSERADKRRYHVLAELRNFLLDSVRESDPDYFLSWDSDMTFGPVLNKLLIGKPVVGALVEMLGHDWMFDTHREASFPSFMFLSSGEGVRVQSWDMGVPFKVGVVMGTVMMDRGTFERVQYRDHPQGEDIGFALCCEELGIEQWLAPGARGIHLHEGPGDRENA